MSDEITRVEAAALSPGTQRPRACVTDAWKAEIDRREAEFRAGNAELMDHDEVMARVRAILR